MGKISHLRLCRPAGQEPGIGREELAVLLGEREPDEEEGRPSNLPRQGRDKGRGKKTR
jgi:hypothetical protein